MDQETPDGAPEAPEMSPEDRIAAALLADEDTADEAPEEGNAEPEEEPSAEEPSDTPPEDDGAEEVEFEGKAYKVPKELKPALLRTEDYTRKTMEVAAMRKQVEDRAHYLEFQQQVFSSAAQEIADLRSTEAELKRYAEVDWSSVDPSQALGYLQRQRVLEQTVADKRRKIEQITAEARGKTEQHNSLQWKLAVEGARQALGAVSKEDDAKALQLVEGLGFTKAEMPKLADARILQLVFKAAKYDALQAAKPSVTKKAESARPMKVAARSAPQAQAEGKALQARQALKKTGSSDAAEAYFTEMFARKG
jgi:hypothetical protein